MPEIFAHDPAVHDPRLYNHDLAPTLPERRTWNMWHIASLWVGMAVCITTYTLAGGLINAGMTWWQAQLTITLANLIVLVPMVLNAHAGTKYGVPFPVLLRSSFGTRGANLPALMRAFVACGWFGIQTWIGGFAIYMLHAKIFGFTPVSFTDPAQADLLLPVIGLSLGQLGCFLLFWAVNMYFIVAGTESIKWLETFSAPFLLIVGGGLLWWAVSKAGGFGVVLSDDTVNKVRGGAAAGDFNFWKVFWPSLTAMVGYWATLSLNIPDFSRFAPTQKDQMLGQLIGLPTTMAFYCFIGIAVTAATVVIFGEAISDPVTLLGRFDSKLVVGFALFALVVATLSTNIAANVVSPANDISNLAPEKISFKMGGIITGFIGIFIFPWKLYNDPHGYVFTWLIGYGGLLGSIAGVMLADYFIVRKASLNLDALYRSDAEYAYGGSGWNWRAVVAVIIGILPNVPGFLYNAVATTENPAPENFWTSIYVYSWFLSLLISGTLYTIFSLAAPGPKSERMHA